MHKKWSEKETPEELREDLEAMKEEKELSEQLKGPGPLCNTSGSNIFWNFNFLGVASLFLPNFEAKIMFC